MNDDLVLIASQCSLACELSRNMAVLVADSKKRSKALRDCDDEDRVFLLKRMAQSFNAKDEYEASIAEHVSSGCPLIVAYRKKMDAMNIRMG